jgi:RNA recognition motif-containing protein
VKVIDVRVNMERETGRSRGFAHVDVRDSSKAAFKALRGASLGGRQLRVDLSDERRPQGGERKSNPSGGYPGQSDEREIFVGNLDFGTTSESLADALSAFGSVEHASVKKDRETGRSRGFGFVTMGSPQEARKVARAESVEVDGRQVRINYGRSTSGDRGSGRGDRGSGRGDRGSGRGGRGGRGSSTGARGRGGIAGYAGTKTTFD